MKQFNLNQIPFGLLWFRVKNMPLWREISSGSSLELIVYDTLHWSSSNKGQGNIVKLSQSLNLSLSLRDRDRADTIITLYHTTPPILHHKLFKCLLGDLYSSVIHHWNHQLKPYSFPLRKIGLIRVTYDPPVSIRVNKYYRDLYSSVIHHWNRQLKPYWFPLRKIGLIRVRNYLPCQF